MRFHHGFTLIEVAVTLVILGIALASVSLALGVLGPAPGSAIPRTIASARSQAIHSGAVTRVGFGRDTVALFPDGSASGGPVRDSTGVWSVDRWTGEARRVR